MLQTIKVKPNLRLFLNRHTHTHTHAKKNPKKSLTNISYFSNAPSKQNYECECANRTMNMSAFYNLL